MHWSYHSLVPSHQYVCYWAPLHWTHWGCDKNGCHSAEDSFKCIFLNEPVMVRLLTHICVARPEWVKCAACLLLVLWLCYLHPYSLLWHVLNITYRISNSCLLLQGLMPMSSRELLCPDCTEMRVHHEYLSLNTNSSLFCNKCCFAAFW